MRTLFFHMRHSATRMQRALNLHRAFIGKHAKFTPSLLSRIRRLAAERKPKLTPLRHKPPQDPEVRRKLAFDKRSSRKAAVLVPLCNVAGEASVLFTLRSQNVGSHRGQVAFPGGHKEGNESPEMTALRELTEEIGTEAGTGLSFLGRHRQVMAITGTMVYPVLGYLGFRDGLLTPDMCLIRDSIDRNEVE